ncbi:MAG: HNH endonuclease [Armatimonadetes bacterium]|nr:HNH endonuclease [Armatimonadota bacterium]
MKGALLNRPLYRSRDLEFCKLVLRELDVSMQSHGMTADYTTITSIEHIMPQTLDRAWKEYLGEDVDSDEYDRLINTIGNLCLVSASANSSYSNHPFQQKLESYSDLTALVRDVKENHANWRYEDIRQRSSRLAERAIEVWNWNE